MFRKGKGKTVENARGIIRVPVSLLAVCHVRLAVSDRNLDTRILKQYEEKVSRKGWVRWIIFWRKSHYHHRIIDFLIYDRVVSDMWSQVFSKRRSPAVGGSASMACMEL